MWPEDYHDWRGEGLFHAVFASVWRWLARSPVLASDAPHLAYTATECAFDLVQERREYPGWFVNANLFRRWLEETVRREARRLLLQVEQVRLLLGELHDVARQLLYWHYADQLTAEQIAAIVSGSSEKPGPLEVERAGEMVRRAYDQFCTVLQARELGRGRWTFPW